MQFDNHGVLKMTKMNYDKDRPKAENPLKIMDISLRDGHQSLFATRGRTEDMIPVAEMMDEIGFWGVEVWGGATFDVCMRFLRENPWTRLNLIRQAVPNILLQMLIRGSNGVGYKAYPDNLIERFIEKSWENGIDIFRIFDDKLKRESISFTGSPLKGLQVLGFLETRSFIPGSLDAGGLCFSRGRPRRPTPGILKLRQRNAGT